jgi:hypothetical protein
MNEATVADARQAFFAEKTDRFYAAVAWPGIEGGLRVRSMTLDEMETYHAETNRREEVEEDVRANERLLIACVCLPDGTPMFRGSDEGKLAAMDFRDLKKLIKAANRANGFGEEEDDDGKNS